MSIRIVNTLKEVDFITDRRYQKYWFVAQAFGITTKQISFPDIMPKKNSDLIRLLKNGQDIAQVSDAGTQHFGPRV